MWTLHTRSMSLVDLPHGIVAVFCRTAPDGAAPSDIPYVCDRPSLRTSVHRASATLLRVPAPLPPHSLAVDLAQCGVLRQICERVTFLCFRLGLNVVQLTPHEIKCTSMEIVHVKLCKSQFHNVCPAAYTSEPEHVHLHRDSSRTVCRRGDLVPQTTGAIFPQFLHTGLQSS